jgi:uncharacterized membrane protein YcaP (DUF421 family)
MLSFITPGLEILLRTTAVYLVILVGLRLAGKRELGQMTVFDLVLLLLIANAVQNAMVGEDTSLAGGLWAAAILLLLNMGLAHLRVRWPRLCHLVEGSPTLLVLHGKPILEHLRQEGLDEEMLETALREHGLAELKDVEMAVLEIDGSISVIPTHNTVTHRVKPARKFMRR